MGFFPFSTGSQGLVAPVALQAAAGATPVFAAGTTGDAFNRVELDANGGIRFGTGAGAPDATLSRQAILVKSIAASRCIVVPDLKTAIQVANDYAPEHLLPRCCRCITHGRNVPAAIFHS